MLWLKVVVYSGIVGCLCDIGRCDMLEFVVVVLGVLVATDFVERLSWCDLSDIVTRSVFSH